MSSAGHTLVSVRDIFASARMVRKMIRPLSMTLLALLLAAPAGKVIAFAQHDTAKRFTHIRLLRTGNGLSEACDGFEKDAHTDYGCVLYIRGMYEAIQFTDITTNGQTYLYRSCPDKDVTEQQVYAIVAKWMKQHPEKWTMPAVSIVAIAMSEAFPCN
jgi:Rap1a immunity proteins